LKKFTTYDGRQVMAIAHMTLWVRRAKNCVTLIKQLQNKWRLTENFENEISDSGTTISGFADCKKKN